ncbi:MAG: methylated-DNA--[protein]-cysteine S-methyltransferase [Cytophagales bacterium]|nr:MAG: methylated-DNA--[protein]-cysteine S-methyltransferase [Cytophagales bacterium]
MSFFCTLLESPLGKLYIETNTEALQKVLFWDEKPIPTLSLLEDCPAIMHQTLHALQQYFSNDLHVFDLPIHWTVGTAFQQRVWQELCKIPYGTTISYAFLAHRLNDPLCIRAAASANGKNPIAIIVPCHRVIGSKGELTGYAGGLHRKKWLLQHEKGLVENTLFG